VKFSARKEHAGFFSRVERELVVVVVEEECQIATYQLPQIGDDDALPWRREVSWRPAAPLDMADPALRWVVDGQVLA
jgi:hypothetical protein